MLQMFQVSTRPKILTLLLCLVVMGRELRWIHTYRSGDSHLSLHTALRLSPCPSATAGVSMPDRFTLDLQNTFCCREPEEAQEPGCTPFSGKITLSRENQVADKKGANPQQHMKTDRQKNGISTKKVCAAPSENKQKKWEGNVPRNTTSSKQTAQLWVGSNLFEMTGCYSDPSSKLPLNLLHRVRKLR